MSNGLPNPKVDMYTKAQPTKIRLAVDVREYLDATINYAKVIGEKTNLSKLVNEIVRKHYKKG